MCTYVFTLVTLNLKLGGASVGGASVAESSSAAMTSSEGVSSRSLSQPEARVDSEDTVLHGEEEEHEAVGGASGGGASGGTSSGRSGSVDGFAKPKAPLSKQ